MTRPLNLVVPDGNWRQTGKMIRRDGDMAQIPRVTLPVGNPSAYRIRTERRQEGLATIEAIARALGIIESPEVQAALEDLLAVKVSRTLASRGVVVRL
jgi:DTW domain-containing protein YfiP